MSAPETQSILITQARPELVSGKSNSVSGNYTCRVGLVQTQLRCKTRGEGCKCKSASFLSAPLLMHRCVVQCSGPPIFFFFSFLFFFFSLSPSLRLSLPPSIPPSFSLPLLPPDKTAAAPSVCEDKKSPLDEIAHLTLPPAAGEKEEQLSSDSEKGGKTEIAAAHLALSIQAPTYS